MRTWTVTGEALWGLRFVVPFVAPLIPLLSVWRSAGPGDQLHAAMVTVLLGALWVVGTVMVARQRVRIAATGLEVRSRFRTRTYAWDQIVGARVDPEWERRGVSLLLVGGQTEPLPLPTGTFRRPSEDTLADAVAAIERARADRQG